MKETVVCVFAHPDDEAFGPGGTIAILAQTYDVYIICATKGDAGQNSHPDKDTPLEMLRTNELLLSSKVLGVKEVIFLEYKDGTLCNGVYHQLAADITKHLEKLQPAILLTYENRGISGHIDHITVSMVTTFLFYKTPSAKNLYYYCLSKDQRATVGNDYFIYFPPGYDKDQITKTFDTTAVWERKLEAMQKHQSQIHDINRILARSKDRAKQEDFIILKK